MKHILPSWTAALAALSLIASPMAQPQGSAQRRQIEQKVRERAVEKAAERAAARARAEAVRTGWAEHGPKLLVLLHGATPAPGDAASPGVPEPAAGTLDYTRFYFGYDFVRRLMGVSAQTGLKTLSGVVLHAQAWDSHGTPDAQGKVTFTQGARESVVDDHFVVPGDATASDGQPRIAALLTFRDGSQGLMDQTRAAVDQIYEDYVARFGDPADYGQPRPQIFLVAHSMGCLVSRVLLSAPEDPIQGLQLSAEQRGRAAALRDRTVCLIALAGPHEGSPVADRATNLLDQVNGLPAPIVGVLDAISGGLASDVKRDLRKALGRDSVRDLRSDVWSQLNAGVLEPQRARRADGTLVPIYTLIGHTPGGDFYSDPLSAEQFPSGGIGASDLASEDGRRNAVRSLGLMVVDYLLHNAPGDGPKSWGTTSRGSAFDQVARYHRKALGLTLSEPGEDQGMPLGFPKFYSHERVTRREDPLLGEPRTVVLRTDRDGEVDSDGLVPVASGHGNKLGTGTAGYFDHAKEWSQTGGKDLGSWYRLSSEGMPWKLENHEGIHRDPRTGGWLHQNLVAQAGPLVAEDEVSVWPAPQPAAAKLNVEGLALRKALAASALKRPKLRPLVDER